MTDDDERKPLSSPEESAPDAPATPEEEAAAARLREALRGGGDPLASALRAAWAPEAIDPREHAAILDDLPTEEELVLAEELRRALDRGAAPPLVSALESAWRPRELSGEDSRVLVKRALERAGEPAKEATVIAIAARRRPIQLVALTTTVIALAAAIVLWVRTNPTGPSEAPLARVRSTQELFDEPFRSGEAAARIDKIAVARASDYRDNRFAKWGVK